MAYDVAVVGAGFSAIAVTINLLKQLPPHSSIAVIGDDPCFGRGTAYRSEFYVHRLNVPAGRMSIFPDEPNDFLEWLTRTGRPVSPDLFASRSDYGLYLRDTLAALLRNRTGRPRLDFVKTKATGCVVHNAEGLLFHLDQAPDLIARRVVLCLGVGSAKAPLPDHAIDYGIRARFVESPWRLNWLSRVGRDDSICILGSGLTMIDQVLALRSQGHQGSIHVLSRRGLVPHAHDLRHATTPPALELPMDNREISALLATFRRQVRNGTPWRAIMDALRPQTQNLWQELSEVQRARFLRHALPWWNIHRHRIDPALAERFYDLIEDTTVTIHAGYVKSIEENRGRACIHYRPRGTQMQKTIAADWVINSTGMERAGIAHSPLLRQMAEKQLLTANPLGLGIEVDRQSRLIGRDGAPHTDLYAVGALTAGQFWEITAVPDIRKQALEVASIIAADQSIVPA